MVSALPLKGESIPYLTIRQKNSKRPPMTKRKPGTFSATKAVKANARARVGQPKPARVVATEPRTGREAKHKPKLEEIIHQEE